MEKQFGKMAIPSITIYKGSEFILKDNAILDTFKIVRINSNKKLLDYKNCIDYKIERLPNNYTKIISSENGEYLVNCDVYMKFEKLAPGFPENLLTELEIEGGETNE